MSRLAQSRPVTTYRLQLHREFTLDHAREVVAYLDALGVTDCYCSPVFMARPGSTHGYDICNHGEINVELGGERAFEEFSAEVQRRGMGLVLDFVPNHMSNDSRTSEWWRDVLENGPSSPFSEFFDIDWDPVKPELKDRLLLPILGEQYGTALERGALALSFDRGTLALSYGDQTIPINPRRTPLVFEHGLAGLEAVLGDDASLREFLSILTALRNLPPYTERDPGKIVERHREKIVARDRLERLVDASAPIREHIEAAVAVFNGNPDDPASFDQLHALLELQPYRLASWRTAADEINYRRFFDINELAGLRVEDEKVFAQIHALVLRLIVAGQVRGLRIDHIDGLFDPAGYLARLQEAIRLALDGSGRDGVMPAGGDRPWFYVLVEKILGHDERLRGGWQVAGTTGYDFLNDLNGVFVDAGNAKDLRRIYARFSGRREAFADVAYESRRLIVSTALSSEFQVLAQAVNRLSERDRRSRDFTLANIRRALREVVACFPVYRTYVSEDGSASVDREVVMAAVAEARHRNPAMESSIFDFLQATMLPDDPSNRRRLNVAMRFQQYTAPVQAKGTEDTAFYRHHPLVSLNEVGGDVHRFGRSVAEFHAANAERQADWPTGMLATTTHDTKRSEDARARINVLSEIPDEWQKGVAQWLRLNAACRTRLADGPSPDANDEYLFYQALLGAWPAEGLDEKSPVVPGDLVARMTAYMNKAIKEAKTHTSWITENRPYELGVSRFVEQSLTGPSAPAFLAAFVPFVRRVAPGGMLNALSQLVLKMVSPGVADFYQGTEFWDYSLVDPDNRRPVDYDRRQRQLQDLEPWLARTAVDDGTGDADIELAGAVAAMLKEWPDARIKMFVTACGMRLRRTRAALFLEGDYLPMQAEGPAADHVIACARQHGDELLLAVVPRLTTILEPSPGALPLGGAVWMETALPMPEAWRRRSFRHVLTGERVNPLVHRTGRSTLLVRHALATCPVALLWGLPPTAD